MIMTENLVISLLFLTNSQKYNNMKCCVPQKWLIWVCKKQLKVLGGWVMSCLLEVRDIWELLAVTGVSHCVSEDLALVAPEVRMSFFPRAAWELSAVWMTSGPPAGSASGSSPRSPGSFRLPDRNTGQRDRESDRVLAALSKQPVN